MSTTHVLSALLDKRAELSGLVLDLEKRLAETRGGLIHVDACLRLFGWNEPLETIRPKKVTTRSLFGRNELQRIIFDEMRAHPDGVTVRSLSETICAQKGWDAADRAFMAALMHKVGVTLNKLKRSERATSELAGNIGVWRLPGR